MKFIKEKKIISIVLVLIIIGSAVFGDYSNVEAAGKKVTTNVKYNKNWKKSPALKTGKTSVNLNVPFGTVKFVAPKTKVYKITFSNVYNRKDRAYHTNGFFSIYEVSEGKKPVLILMPCKTYGGSTSTLWVANKPFLKDWKQDSTSKVNQYRLSRTITIKLKKGQAIYFSGYFGEKIKAGYTVTIK